MYFTVTFSKICAMKGIDINSDLVLQCCKILYVRLMFLYVNVHVAHLVAF
jgi:hypothetical protein